MFVRLLATTLCLALTLALGAPAHAQDTSTGAEALVTVNVNMARVLRINAPAATVIIGNPGIADVTIQDPTTLVLTGKAYGRTNMIILDSEGEPIADTLVSVSQTNDDVVTVFQGSVRTSVACAPRCAPTIVVGDDPEYTQEVISSSDMVEAAAQ